MRAARSHGTEAGLVVEDIDTRTPITLGHEVAGGVAEGFADVTVNSVTEDVRTGVALEGSPRVPEDLRAARVVRRAVLVP